MSEEIQKFSPKCVCTACGSLNTKIMATLIRKRRRYHKCVACGHLFRSLMLDAADRKVCTTRCRKPKRFAWEGEMKTLRELAVIAGMPEKKLRRLLGGGMSLADAMISGGVQ